jgi:hypothetical protein
MSDLALKVKNLAKAAIRETELADQIAEGVKADDVRKQTIQNTAENMRRHATALVQGIILSILLDILSQHCRAW